MQADNTEQTPRELHVFAVLVILFVTILPYLNSLHGVFDFDDVRHITENPFIRIHDLSWSSLTAAVTKGPSSQRWLPMLTFAFNYYAGVYDSFGYHLVNLAIHALSSLLLYNLFCLLLPLVEKNLSKRRVVEISLVATLLWALHPVQTNVVTYIVQRMTGFAAMFSLAACVCYIKGRLTSVQKHRWTWWFFTVILWLLALSCKESAAILPLAILGMDYFFFRSPDQSSRPYLVSLGLVGLIGVILVTAFLGTNLFTVLHAGYVKYEFNMGERVLTEATIIFYYIGILLLPLPSRLNLCYDYPVSHSLLDPPWTLAAVIGIFCLVWLIFFLYRNHRLLSFALFWFLVNLIIESSIFPIELIYEHRLYFPATMLFLAFVVFLYRFFSEKRIVAVRGLMALLCLLLAIGTWQRNKVWGSTESLWLDVVKKSPGITRGYTNLGRVYNRQGKYEKSMAYLRKGLEIDPTNALMWLNIGYIYMVKNQPDEALSAYKKALFDRRIVNSEYKVRTGMAFAYVRKNQPVQALEEAERSIRVNPDYANAWLARGMSLGLLGQHEKALESGRRVTTLDPHLPEGYLLVGQALDHMGRSREALAVINQGQGATGNTEAFASFRSYLRGKILPGGR